MGGKLYKSGYSLGIMKGIAGDRGLTLCERHLTRSGNDHLSRTLEAQNERDLRFWTAKEYHPVDFLYPMLSLRES
jgi:hypothetical protein